MKGHPASLRACRLLIAVVALAAFGMSSVPANAEIAPATADHTRIGFVPAFGSVPPHNTACGNGQNCSLLSYHNNGQVQHAQKLYAIFWVPSGSTMPASFQTDVKAWISNFAKANYTQSTVFSVAQQYYDHSGPSGATRFVPYALANGGTFTDTTPFPASTCTDQQNGVNTPVCLDQSQQAAEVQSFVIAHHLPKGPNVEYLLFTPQNVGSCFAANGSPSNCSYSGYCAYHSNINAGTSSEIVWANEPWVYQVTGCDLQYMGYGAGYASNSIADPEFSILSHEIIETMTDVNLNAWYDSSGNEIGDKCAYNYNGSAVATWTGLSNNGFGYWNQQATKQYLMQYEFSNMDSNGTTTGCVGKITQSQPTATVSPSTAVRGTPQTFTATVTTPSAPLAYITWSFGDGTASVVTTTGSISHTYPTTVAAGTKSLVVIVTDQHGNEKRVTQPVSVS